MITTDEQLLDSFLKKKLLGDKIDVIIVSDKLWNDEWQKYIDTYYLMTLYCYTFQGMNSLLEDNLFQLFEDS